MEFWPRDILYLIFQLLDYKSCLQIKQVNKRFYNIINDNFWFAKAIKESPSLKHDKNIEKFKKFPEINYLRMEIKNIKIKISNTNPYLKLSETEKGLGQLASQESDRQVRKQLLTRQKELYEERRQENKNRKDKVDKEKGILKPYHLRLTLLRIKNKTLHRKYYLELEIDDNFDHQVLKDKLGKKYRYGTLIKVKRKDNQCFIYIGIKIYVSCNLPFSLTMEALHYDWSKYDLQYIYHFKYPKIDKEKSLHNKTFVREIQKKMETELNIS